MKLRRIITRRKAKWAGLVLCLLLGAVFVASRWAQFSATRWSALGDTWSPGGLKRYVEVKEGRLEIGELRLPTDVPYGGQTSVSFEMNDNPRLRLWLDWELDDLGQGFGVFLIRCPLWMPLLLLATPTAWLFRADRRFHSWQCRACRYDLRGLEGGGEEAVCPECGLVIGEG